MEVFSIN